MLRDGHARSGRRVDAGRDGRPGRRRVGRRAPGRDDARHRLARDVLLPPPLHRRGARARDGGRAPAGRRRSHRRRTASARAAGSRSPRPRSRPASCACAWRTCRTCATSSGARRSRPRRPTPSSRATSSSTPSATTRSPHAAPRRLRAARIAHPRALHRRRGPDGPDLPAVDGVCRVQRDHGAQGAVRVPVRHARAAVDASRALPRGVRRRVLCESPSGNQGGGGAV